MAAPPAKRMQVKPGQTILVVNAPKDYAQRLGGLPDGARLVTRRDRARADHVRVFTSGVYTDMTRDRGWDAVTGEIDAVCQVAVDDTWSALRFNAVADAGRRGERRRA